MLSAKVKKVEKLLTNCFNPYATIPPVILPSLAKTVYLIFCKRSPEIKNEGLDSTNTIGIMINGPDN